MSVPTYENGRYYDENGNIVDKEDVRGRYLGHNCGNSLCDCRPASMWDTWNGKFVCAACAKELNIRKALMFGHEASARCVEPPQS